MSVLQSRLPPDLIAAARQPLPKMAPVPGPWITVDDAYGAQIALRQQLMAERPGDVLARAGETGAVEAALLAAVQDGLDAHPGFDRQGRAVRCPDGRCAALDPAAPLESLGAILAEDLCLLERRGDEHVLIAAAVCFPAGWTLAEKIGQPLTRIHRPVPPYDAAVAPRVQRFFDAVQPGRPLWRANLHGHDDPVLYLPQPEAAPKRKVPEPPRYWRAERQTVLRLTATAVLFAIHTSIVATEGSEANIEV